MINMNFKRVLVSITILGVAGAICTANAADEKVKAGPKSPKPAAISVKKSQPVKVIGTLEKDKSMKVEMTFSSEEDFRKLAEGAVVSDCDDRCVTCTGEGSSFGHHETICNGGFMAGVAAAVRAGIICGGSFQLVDGACAGAGPTVSSNECDGNCGGQVCIGSKMCQCASKDKGCGPSSCIAHKDCH